jgi:hypothetical protein
MKKMGLSIRIASGFLIILIIASSMCIWSMWRMNVVKKQCVRLNDEFITELGVANNIEH